jgi:shikimate kinase
MKAFIIGFMGAGKTTFARELAAQMNLQHVDLDQLIEERERVPTAEFFKTTGERVFREVEARLLAEIATSPGDAVISLGGGAPCTARNIDVIKQNGKSVYLKLPLGELVRRLEVDVASGVQRPLLEGDEDLQSVVRNLLRTRERFYLQADVVIDPRQVTPAIMADVLGPGS